MNIDQANRRAVDKMIAARPMLVGVAKAQDVVPGLHDGLLLHAGPPIEWPHMSGPLKGAVIGALIYEGLAADAQEATALVESGDVDFAPCHHHATVGPMAGVVSSSMSVYVVENVTGGNRAYSTLNEGYGKVLRYGAYSSEVLDRLRWMDDSMAPLLSDALSATEGLDLRVLLAEALPQCRSPGSLSWSTPVPSRQEPGFDSPSR